MSEVSFFSFLFTTPTQRKEAWHQNILPKEKTGTTWGEGRETWYAIADKRVKGEQIEER